MDSDSFFTISRRTFASLKEKKSKFLGCAAPVSSRNEAEDLIADISRQYHDATHNCYAYRVGMGRDTTTCSSDAGEPSGTAGKPILQAIEANGLTNVAVVVTRYFGGIKLGTGGLVRAYGACARLVLEAAQIEKKYLTSKLVISFPYSQTGAVMRQLTMSGAEIIHSEYDTASHLTISVRRGNLDQLIHNLKNATAATLKTTIIER